MSCKYNRECRIRPSNWPLAVRCFRPCVWLSGSFSTSISARLQAQQSEATLRPAARKRTSKCRSVLTDAQRRTDTALNVCSYASANRRYQDSLGSCLRLPLGASVSFGRKRHRERVGREIYLRLTAHTRRASISSRTGMYPVPEEEVSSRSATAEETSGEDTGDVRFSDGFFVCRVGTCAVTRGAQRDRLALRAR